MSNIWQISFLFVLTAMDCWLKGASAGPLRARVFTVTEVFAVLALSHSGTVK